MPEQLTKHPEVTLRVLRSAGARCGSGAEQEILTTCPADRFCKLPGGELCVFGLADATRMTQISVSEWRSLAPAAEAAATAGAALPGSSLVPALLAAGIALVLGAWLGHWRGRRAGAGKDA